jgi:hypothetical protein
MNIKPTLLAAIFLSACGPLEVAPQQVMQATPRVADTQTPDPTPTLDYAATVAAAQADADQARQAAIQSQAEAINARETALAAGVEIARFTEAAASTALAETQVGRDATSTAIAKTETAQPTAMALIETQRALQIVQLTAQADYITAQAAEPQRLKELSAARDVARYGWMSYMAQVIAALAALTLAAGVMVVLWDRRWHVENVAPEIIPFDEIKPGYYIRSEIDCTIEDLIEFARLYTEGTPPSYNAMTDAGMSTAAVRTIRQYMQEHRLAKVQHNSNGALTILPEGETFLRETLRNGKPPSPHVCTRKSGSNSHDEHDFMVIKSVGE